MDAARYGILIFVKETNPMDISNIIAYHVREIGGEGIREIAEKGKLVSDPFDFSVGQPDFDVPDNVKLAATNAILSNRNRYTATGGIKALREAIAIDIAAEHTLWKFAPDRPTGFDVIVTGGVTGGIYLALASIVDPGDEIIIGEPSFLLYPEAIKLVGGVAKRVDTYPDFLLTAEKIEEAITAKTKAIILNTPNNPTGAVIGRRELELIASVSQRRGVVVISDEIYRDFSYTDDRLTPSIADYTENALIFRGFSKSHAMTGLRIGYAAGPSQIIHAMVRIQGQTFVSASSAAQYGALEATRTDISHHVREYRERRNLVTTMLADVAQFSPCDGGFYFFIEVPAHLGLTATEFVELAIEQSVLVVPGLAFSARDTHVRLSITQPEKKLREGLLRMRRLLAKGQNGS